MVIRYLAEDTEAPEILEAAVDSASRAMGNHQSIQFFEAYLLRSVARESVRRLRRNQRISYVDNVGSRSLAGTVVIDLDRQLDDAKRIEAFSRLYGRARTDDVRSSRSGIRLAIDRQAHGI